MSVVSSGSFLYNKYAVSDYAEILYDDDDGDGDLTSQTRSEVLAPEAASPNVRRKLFF